MMNMFGWADKWISLTGCDLDVSWRGVVVAQHLAVGSPSYPSPGVGVAAGPVFVLGRGGKTWGSELGCGLRRLVY
jgi:hypothetical protein